jgi:hypothetical protein
MLGRPIREFSYPTSTVEVTMHDLDRTLQEYESSVDALEADGLELEGDWEAESDSESDGEAVFDEIEEMELAASLLEIQDEAELDQFIGNLVKRGFRAIGKVARGPIGQALGGVLKNVARTALPMAGAALGNLVVPGAGGLVGGKLASMAGKMFVLELEGLSPQDQEFEVARRVVRLGGEAVGSRCTRTRLGRSLATSPSTASSGSWAGCPRRCSGRRRARCARTGVATSTRASAWRWRCATC